MRGSRFTIDRFWCDGDVEYTDVLAMMLSKVAYEWADADVLALPQLDWAHFGDDAVVELVQRCEALLARIQAGQLKAVAELRKRRGDDRGAADEVALARSVSFHAADKQVQLACDLDRRYPKVLAAMRRGELDAWKASRICETGLPLDDGQAAELDEHMATRVAGRDASAIQQSARYRVDRLDPQGAARRAQRRRTQRRVELQPDQDAMAWLSGYLPAEVASAAYGRIDAIAKSCRSRGDERSLDEVRADVLAELLLGTSMSHRQVVVHLTVPITSLLGASDLPAHLDGYGWIPADIARQMAAEPGCTWRRLLTDPTTGQLMEVGRRSYRPPAQLDEFVRARDQRCRVPGCRRPARRSDIDHNQDWANGGQTAERWLACLCRRHHRLKDKPGWTFTLDDNGDLYITTPTGRTHRSTVPRLAQPEAGDDSKAQHSARAAPGPHTDADPPPF